MKTSSDLRRGALVGFVTGLLFAIWAAIVFARRGAAPLEAAHTSLSHLVRTYLIIGVVAGGLIGGLWRVGRSTAGCYLVAVPGASAIALGIILMNGTSWAAWDVETWSLLGVLICIGTLVIGNQINVRRLARAQGTSATG